MGKLDDIEIDEKILKPEEEEIFEEQEEQQEQLALPHDPAAAKFTLPAHIKRSHRTEEDDWNFNILTASKNRLSLKVGTKEMAKHKRSKLYNARTYLKYIERLRVDDPTYCSPLDDWTLILQEREGCWYIVALNTKLSDGWEEESES